MSFGLGPAAAEAVEDTGERPDTSRNALASQRDYREAHKVGNRIKVK